jgi:hypothetical protein
MHQAAPCPGASYSGTPRQRPGRHSALQRVVNIDVREWGSERERPCATRIRPQSMDRQRAAGGYTPGRQHTTAPDHVPCRPYFPVYRASSCPPTVLKLPSSHPGTQEVPRRAKLCAAGVDVIGGPHMVWWAERSAVVSGERNVQKPAS